MQRDKSFEIDAELSLGDGVAVIRYRGRSEPVVIGVLGVEEGEDGKPARIWLDRRIHENSHRSMGEWDIWGPVSTVLTRRDMK